MKSSVSYGKVGHKYYWDGVLDGMCYITVQKLRLKIKFSKQQVCFKFLALDCPLSAIYEIFTVQMIF